MAHRKGWGLRWSRRGVIQIHPPSCSVLGYTKKGCSTGLGLFGPRGGISQEEQLEGKYADQCRISP